MSLDNFIPEIWSARLLRHLDKNLIFKTLVNTDYEGEIKEYGDTVKIGQIGDVDVSDYVPNTDLADPQTLDGSQKLLTIDKAKSFNFQIDDVDKAQTHPKIMDKAMLRAGYAVANDIDQVIAGLWSSAGTTTTVADIGHASGDILAYDVVVDAKQKMDELNIPEEGRWMVIPPWFHTELLKDEDYKQSWMNYMATGVVPNVVGIAMLRSNNIKTATLEYKIMAGTREAISFAGQVTEIEAYRMEKRFSDAMKGLYVFGTDVIQPAALICVAATKSTD